MPPQKVCTGDYVLCYLASWWCTSSASCMYVCSWLCAAHADLGAGQ